MGWNGSGAVTLLYDWTARRDAGPPQNIIGADEFDEQQLDIAGAIEQTLNRNGENAIAANISWGGFRLTTLSDPAAAADAVNASTVAENTVQFGGTTGGSANAYTVTNAFLVAKVVGTRILCIANHSNSGAATVNVNAAGVEAIVRPDGSSALVGGEIVSGQIIELVWDGVSWVLIHSSGTEEGDFSDGTVTIGVNDSVAGTLSIYGNATTTGGEVVLYQGGAAVGNDYYYIDVHTDENFRIGRNNDAGTADILLATDGDVTLAQNGNVVVSNNLDVLGTVTLTTDLAIAHGGTGASTDSAARTNLGVAIGSDVQAYDAGLQSISGLTTAADRMIYTTASDTYAVTTLTPFARTLLDDTTNTIARTTLGVAIGSDVQAYDAGLQSISGLTTAADRMIYTTALDTYAVTNLTSFARTLLDDTTDTVARATLGVAVGSDVQAYDAGLQSISGLVTAADRMIYTTASDAYAVTTLTSFARNLLDDTTNTEARTTLGLGSLATLSTINNSNWSGTDLAVANGGTGASTDSGARTNLGLVIGTNVQAYDAGLADIAGLATTNSNFIVGNGTNWVAETGATARTSLGLTIGTDVQAYDAGLADIAGLATTNSNFIVGNGTNWVAETGATARTSLGLGTADNVTHNNITADGTLTVDGVTTLSNYTGGMMVSSATGVLTAGMTAHPDNPKSLSGTSSTFASIPSWPSNFILLGRGVSHNSGTENLRLRLGDSGGIETSGYSGGTFNDTLNSSPTASFGLTPGSIVTASDQVLFFVHIVYTGEANVYVARWSTFIGGKTAYAGMGRINMTTGILTDLQLDFSNSPTLDAGTTYLYYY